MCCHEVQPRFWKASVAIFPLELAEELHRQTATSRTYPTTYTAITTRAPEVLISVLHAQPFVSCIVN